MTERPTADVAPAVDDTDDHDVAATTREPPRALGVVLALVAAGCLIAVCVSQRWLANRRLGDFGYSPLSFEPCGATCETI